MHLNVHVKEWKILLSERMPQLLCVPNFVSLFCLAILWRRRRNQGQSKKKRLSLTLSFQTCNFGVINLVFARILGEAGKGKRFCELWRLTDKQMGNRIRNLICELSNLSSWGRHCLKYGLSLITVFGRSKFSDFSLAISEGQKCKKWPINERGYTFAGPFLFEGGSHLPQL